MKNIIFLLCLFALSILNLHAQTDDKIRIKPEEDVSLALKGSSEYRFDQFQKGRVYFLNGKSTGGTLNYNILKDQVEFTDKKGDTLSLANPEEVDHIVIDNSHFYYSKGYYEVLEEHPSIKFAVKQKIAESNREKIGAYGNRTNTAAIANVSTTQVRSQNIDLNSNEIVVYSRKVSYFLIDNNNDIRVFNKKNFLKLNSSHKKEIEAYIESNKIDFQKEDDLKKLMQYTSSL